MDPSGVLLAKTEVVKDCHHKVHKDHKGKYRNDSILFVFFVISVVYSGCCESGQDWF